MGLVVKDSGWRIPDELWKRGLLKYDKLKGIDWSWLAMDVADVVEIKIAKNLSNINLRFSTGESDELS